MNLPSSSLPLPDRHQAIAAVLGRARELRAQLGDTLYDETAAATYAQAGAITNRVIRCTPPRSIDWESTLDAALTSRLLGFPIMVGLLGVVLWLTIAGANVPSALLADLLFWVEDLLSGLFAALHAPWWLEGFLIQGVYRGLAWVVAVMLPPMMIFFPCFTLLEDLGYLPRVAFNLDRLFSRAGGSGKQALTMTMGFGCNAAGVTACRIIDSPREKLIAIVTNNFVPCNGRWPTLIMVASIFVGGAGGAIYASLAAAATVVGLTVLGVIVTLVASWALSRTVLKGELSAFTLELPPYRKPRVLRILHTSMIDRTIFVLGRAMVMAAPAGGVCWLLANIDVGGVSLFAHLAGTLDGPGRLMGLDGIILMAFILGLPANEIVVPILIMGYLSQGAMLELDSLEDVRALLVDQNGWTLVTAVCVMLFSLLHYPCSTALWTIHRETGSWKWTLLSFALPTGVAIVACVFVAQTSRLF
ncbi:MAG: ferrous iron transporter B [Planctomycetes bacterium]|nr:ferrous iron transporter B [Planctomycetota bacterium]